MRAKILILSSVFCLLFSACGCEVFRKKFVRKSKAEKEVRTIIHTKEYESAESKEETYKKYFHFWRAAHLELVDLLQGDEDKRKRRIFLAENIIDSLEQMQQYLEPEKQRELTSCILKQKEILQELKAFKLRRIQKLQLKTALKEQRRKIQKIIK